MKNIEYDTTKELCQKIIDKNNPVVCKSCGGEINPIETVNNANKPTFWSGCLKCMVFDGGVKPIVFEIAKKMFEERHFRYYKEQEPEKDSDMYEYYKQSQLRGISGLVYDIIFYYNNLK